MEVLEPEALIDDLRRVLRGRYPVHPLRRLLLAGELTREQLQGWAKNQFHEFRNIHRFFASATRSAPSRRCAGCCWRTWWRRRARTCSAASTPATPSCGPDSARGWASPRDEMQGYEPLPGIKAALEMYVQLVQQSHWAVAIGTGLVFEGEGPQAHGRGAAGARDPLCLDSLGFPGLLRAHEYHDEGHGNFIVDVIKDHVMDGGLQEEMRARGADPRGHHVAAERDHLPGIHSPAAQPRDGCPTRSRLELTSPDPSRIRKSPMSSRSGRASHSWCWCWRSRSHTRRWETRNLTVSLDRDGRGQRNQRHGDDDLSRPHRRAARESAGNRGAAWQGRRGGNPSGRRRCRAGREDHRRPDVRSAGGPSAGTEQVDPAT